MIFHASLITSCVFLMGIYCRLIPAVIDIFHYFSNICYLCLTPWYFKEIWRSVERIIDLIRLFSFVCVKTITLFTRTNRFVHSTSYSNPYGLTESREYSKHRESRLIHCKLNLLIYRFGLFVLSTNDRFFNLFRYRKFIYLLIRLVCESVEIHFVATPNWQMPQNSDVNKLSTNFHFALICMRIFVCLSAKQLDWIRGWILNYL